MPSVCVFCGSSTGNREAYTLAARQLGQLLGKHGHTLVYGGGKVGLMGIVADETLRSGGEVVGIIPDFLYQREVGHDGVTRLEVVQTMHERKKRMADLSDYFVALPGGWGTLDELAEILTWKQLGLIHQPVGLLNTAEFFSPLVAQFQRMTDSAFLSTQNKQQLIIAETPAQLLTLLGVLAV
ncbi:MAG: TIGR00730 family Rossman fold protein [Bacteroidota bacterium]